ncbi:MAG: S8 family serine peptidase [bacterium]|nr:S8 family serine peptidase [bacterium]
MKLSPWTPPICFCIPGAPAPPDPGPTPPPPPVTQPVPWNIAKVGADRVWDRVTGRGVKVTILDTGIDDNHPDLSVSGGASMVPGVTSWDDVPVLALTVRGSLAPRAWVGRGGAKMDVVSMSLGSNVSSSDAPRPFPSCGRRCRIRRIRSVQPQSSSSGDRAPSG